MRKEPHSRRAEQSRVKRFTGNTTESDRVHRGFLRSTDGDGGGEVAAGPAEARTAPTGQRAEGHLREPERLISIDECVT